jgi:hypothetical protein
MEEPKGEQLINCPFCDEDPREEGHFIVSRVWHETHDRTITQLSLTCAHALPESHASDWKPWTFFLVEEVRPKGPPWSHDAPAKDDQLCWPPGVTVTEGDEEWALELRNRLEGTPPG